MIEAISLNYAHVFGDALAAQARLRFRVFVEGRDLPHNHYNGMEYDEFDTPAAVYLVWRDPNLIARGLIRMVPTSEPYMLQQYWPYLCQTRELPNSDKVWEASRVCVDRSYDSRIRPRIMPELLCGVQEFCLHNDIDAVVGVTRMHLISHFLRSGIEWLGEPAEVEGQQEAAMWIATEDIQPRAHCQKYGLSGSVLSLESVEQYQVAA